MPVRAPAGPSSQLEIVGENRGPPGPGRERALPPGKSFQIFKSKSGESRARWSSEGGLRPRLNPHKSGDEGGHGETWTQEKRPQGNTKPGKNPASAKAKGGLSRRLVPRLPEDRGALAKPRVQERAKENPKSGMPAIAAKSERGNLSRRLVPHMSKTRGGLGTESPRKQNVPRKQK